MPHLTPSDPDGFAYAQSRSSSPDHYHDIESLTLTIGKGGRAGRKVSKEKQQRQSSIWTETSEVEKYRATSTLPGGTGSNNKKKSNKTSKSKSTKKESSKSKSSSSSSSETSSSITTTFLENPLLLQTDKNWTLPRVELWCRDPHCIYNQSLWGNHYTYQHPHRNQDRSSSATSTNYYPIGNVIPEVDEEDTDEVYHTDRTRSSRGYYTRSSSNNSISGCSSSQNNHHDAPTMVLPQRQRHHHHGGGGGPGPTTRGAQLHLNMSMGHHNFGGAKEEDEITITHTNNTNSNKADNTFTNNNFNSNNGNGMRGKANSSGGGSGGMMTLTQTPLTGTMGSSISSNTNTDSTILTIHTETTTGSGSSSGLGLTEESSRSSPLEGFSNASTYPTGLDTTTSSTAGFGAGSSSYKLEDGHDIVNLGNHRINNADGGGGGGQGVYSNHKPFRPHLSTPSAASSTNPYCPNCSGVVPLDHLDDADIGGGKSNLKGGEPGFWNFNKFQHPLQRDHSFHSVGGFTLNGQYNTIAKKHTMVKFCSSHKISLVVSTFSLLVTIGLLITLFLMKKRGMMDTMMDS